MSEGLLTCAFAAQLLFTLQINSTVVYHCNCVNSIITVSFSIPLPIAMKPSTPTCLIVQPPAGPAGYFVRRYIHSLMLHNEKSLSNISLVWDWGVASNQSHTYYINILQYMYSLRLLVSRGWTCRTFLYSQVCHTRSNPSSFRGRPVVLDLLLNLVLLLGWSSKTN